MAKEPKSMFHFGVKSVGEGASEDEAKKSRNSIRWNP
jgi:hypothetical protein